MVASRIAEPSVSFIEDQIKDGPPGNQNGKDAALYASNEDPVVLRASFPGCQRLLTQATVGDFDRDDFLPLLDQIGGSATGVNGTRVQVNQGKLPLTGNISHTLTMRTLECESKEMVLKCKNGKKKKKNKKGTNGKKRQLAMKSMKDKKGKKRMKSMMKSKKNKKSRKGKKSKKGEDVCVLQTRKIDTDEIRGTWPVVLDNEGVVCYLEGEHDEYGGKETHVQINCEKGSQNCTGTLLNPQNVFLNSVRPAGHDLLPSFVSPDWDCGPTGTSQCCNQCDQCFRCSPVNGVSHACRHEINPSKTQNYCHRKCRTRPVDYSVAHSH